MMKQLLYLLSLSLLLSLYLVSSCTTDEECATMEVLDMTNNTGGVCDFDNSTINNNTNSTNTSNSTGVCTCNPNLPADCFTVSNGLCSLTQCGVYTNTTSECRLGTRSKTTALLLSIFLINFGAANFYIEQYAYAIPQIIIGLLLCVFQFGSCAATCARSDKEKTSAACIVCCSINSVLSLTIFAWWIADIVIFATDSRDSGDGCPLY
uniref:TM2 domain-containing protein n=1 Tax=Amphimedon queenslandica TaxID=400682 RepID=A0A1X7UD68_AMPQE